MFIKTILLTFVICYSRAGIIADLSGPFDNYSCLATEDDISTVIVSAYHSYGAIDKDALNNIKLSNQAGFSTDISMFPCRGKNATLQVNELIDYLDSMKEIESESTFSYTTGTIWLDIETNPSSGCSWKIGNPQTNCAYLLELISAIESRKRSVGIFSTSYNWNQIFGKDQCMGFKNYPLWYSYYDYARNFNDWSGHPFGGWTLPTLKQFVGDVVICGFSMNLNYF